MKPHRRNIHECSKLPSQGRGQAVAQATGQYEGFFEQSLRIATGGGREFLMFLVIMMRSMCLAECRTP